MSSSKDKVTVYNPSLAALLLASENQRKRPLTKEEVLAVRDTATVMIVTPEIAAKIEAERGHKDINPDKAWEEWQRLREKVNKQQS